MTEEKKFRTSNQSRKKVRKKRSGALWLLILIPLIVGLGVALGLTVLYLLNLRDNKQQQTIPTETTQSAAEHTTKAAESTKASDNTEASESTESTEKTEAPMTTEAETEPEITQPLEPEAKYSPTKSAAELLPVPDGVIRDGDEISKGGWYGGKFVRDLNTGVVKCEWDRSAAIISMLEKYGAIYHKNQDQKVCYLTFDCGGTSSAENVNEILDILKAKGVKAVFFIPGDFLMSNLNREGEAIRPERAEVLRRIAAEGHLIGSHTYNHPQMPKLSDEDFIMQLNTQQNRIDTALGYAYPLSYYRPPEGATSERDLYLAQKMGYHVTLWSYAYLDWDASKQMEVGEALEKAKIGLHDGCVYLLHALSSTNRAMLGDLIDYMKAQGYDVRRIDR